MENIPVSPNTLVSEMHIQEGTSTSRGLEGRESENNQYKRRPIKSYGIILYFSPSFGKKDLVTTSSLEKNDLLFLLCKRRDTYQYQDIIRGKWNDEESLKTLLRKISPDERKRIEENDFEKIWEDFWPDHNSEAFTKRVKESKTKYEICKEVLLSFDEESKESDSSWGFPKGKKNNNRETELQTALREFEEETKIETSNIRIIHSFEPLKESYIGTDGKHYESTYFLARFVPDSSWYVAGPDGYKYINDYRKILPEPTYYQGRIRTVSHSDEIEALRWCSLSEIEEEKYLNEQRTDFLIFVKSFLEKNFSDELNKTDKYTSNKVGSSANVWRGNSFRNNHGERCPFETRYHEYPQVKNDSCQNCYHTGKYDYRRYPRKTSEDRDQICPPTKPL